MDAGFYHDDAVTSDYLSFCALNGKTAWSFAASQFTSMIQFQGRCSPAYCFGITPFLVWIGDDLGLYRAWHLAWTVLALASFSWCVKRATEDWIGAIFAVAVSLALFCTSNYHSSLVSYGVILQQMAVFGFCGVGLAYVAFESSAHRRVAFAASLLSIALAVLTTEFGLIFVLLIALAAYLKLDLRKGAWVAAPYALFALAYIATTAIVKRPGQYEGAAVGTMQPPLIATTWLKQLSGTLPFTFPLTEDGRATLGQHWLHRIVFSPWFWLFFAFSVVIFHWLIRRLPIQTVRNCFFLVLFGSILIVVPPAFTAISAKYQVSLSYGVPYVQVFVQYMGLALAITGAWQWLQRATPTNAKYRAIAQLAFAVVLALTYASTLALNRLTVQQLNRIWHFPRQNLADALSLLSFGKDETPLFIVDRPSLKRWEWAPFAFRHTGHRATFMTLTDFVKERNDGAATVSNNTYFISYPVRSNEDADVFVARIAAVTQAQSGVEVQFASGDARLIRFGPDLESVGDASRFCENTFGLSTPAPASTSKEIRQGRAATVSRVSDRSFLVK